MEMKQHTATARGTNLGISWKFAVEVAKFIQGRKLTNAKKILGEVLEKKTAVPFTRYNMDLGHKRGPMGPGRYPMKAAEEILSLLNSAEMNANNKGLDQDSLFVLSAMANKGSTQMRAGRHRGRHAKRTHFVVILAEKEKKSAEKKEQNKTKKGEKKTK